MVPGEVTDMLAAPPASPGHPAVAVLLGLAAAGLAALVVAMAWSVHARQIRLAGQLARRQAAAAAGEDRDEPIPAEPAARASNGTAPVVIEGPETVTAGEQARYRVQPSGGSTVVSWAVGGGPVSQWPDPAHPGDLLVIADEPGDLTVIARAREGMLERRATKSVTAVADLSAPAPPVMLRMFLNTWGLVAVAILVTGFAAALAALGSLPSSDFLALTAPLAALLAMAAVARPAAEAPRRPGRSRDGERLRR